MVEHVASGRKNSSVPPPVRSKPGFDPSVPLMELEEPPTLATATTRDIASFEIPSKAKARPLQSPPPDLGPVEMSEPMLDVDTLVADNRRSAPPPPPSGGTVVTAPPTPKAVVRRAKVRTPVLHYVIAGGLMAASWGAAGAAAVLKRAPELPELATVSASKPKAEASAPTAEAAPQAEAKAESESESASASASEQVAKASAPTAEYAARVWSTALASTPKAIRATDGAILALLDGSLVGAADGEEVWSQQGTFVGLVSAGDTIVTTRGGEILGFGAQQTPSFSVEIPLPKRKRGKKKQSDVVAVAGSAEHAVIALADARFISVTPSACKDDAGGEECVREVGALRGEYLEPPARVAIGEEGMRYLAEEDSLRAFDLAFSTAFSLSAASEITSLIAVPGNRLAVRFGNEAALLDVARCRGRAEVRLLDGGSTGPRGCVLWRYGKRLDAGEPAAVDTARIAMNEDGKLQVVEEGDDAWKSPLQSIGPVVKGGEQLFTLVRTKAGYALTAVDSRKGTAAWSIPLPLTLDEEGAASIALDWQPGMIAVAVGHQVALVRQPN